MDKLYCGSTKLQVYFLSWLPFQFACYIHDLLYTSHIVSRKEADNIFLFIMLSTSNYHILAYIVYFAVRLFGWKYY